MQTVETPSCDLQIRVIKTAKLLSPSTHTYSKQQLSAGYSSCQLTTAAVSWLQQLSAGYSVAAISSLCHCVIFLTSFICSKHNRYTEYTQQNSMSCAGIFKLSMGARNPVGIGLSNRARSFKLLRSSRIDSKVSISPAYVAWRAGTTTLFLLIS